MKGKFRKTSVENPKNGKEKMRTTKRLKALLIHLLSISMVISPMPLMAEEKTIVNNSEWVGEIGNVLNQVGGAIMQSKQQEFQMRQQAAMMRNAKPQLVPAKFFPQCRIAPAGASVPQACQPNKPPQQLVSEARSMKRVAQQQMDFYEQLLDEAQNSPLPSGIACLKQAKDGVGTSIKDRMNGLERMKQQIAKANQLFEEQNKALLEDIKRNGNELLGIGRGRKVDLNQESADYNSLVTPECRDIIVAGFGGNSDFNDIMAKSGLKGIRNGNLSKLNVSSSQFTANKASYERDLNQKVQQIKSDIQKYGVDSFLEMNQGGLTFERNGQQKFGSLNAAYSDFARVKNEEVKNIRQSIAAEIGGANLDINRLTTMTRNFKADFGEFVSQAEQQLKRQEISRCVSGPIGLSTDQILGSLRYESTSMTGDTITNYTSALQVILDNPDSSPLEKQNQIKNLDGRFKGRIRIVYNDEDSVQRNESPYQMFQKIVQKCEVAYEQETDANAGRSIKKRVARAKKYMQDLQKVERTFASDLTNQLIDEVVNCSGRDLKAGQCGPDTLSPGNSQFCLSQASDCAAQANACYNKIEGEVKIRQGRMNTLATQYNNNMAALITQQEAILNNVKAQVTRDAEFFKSFFPGATYDVPEDLFVEMPQLADFQGLGVELRGGGDLEVMKALPGKIDKLKEQLAMQWEGGSGNKGIANVIDEYIELQRSAMIKNAEKWNSLLDACVAAEGSALKSIAQANQKAKEAYGERANTVNNFCQRFEDLRSNPMAGCNDDYDVGGLYEDGMKVSAHINDDALRYVGTYRGLCAQSQNEKDKNSDDDADTSGKTYIQELCEEGDSESALAEVRDELKAAGVEDEHLSFIFESRSKPKGTDVRELKKKYEGKPAVADLIGRAISLKDSDRKAREDYDEYFKDASGVDKLASLFSNVIERGDDGKTNDTATATIRKEKAEAVQTAFKRKVKDKGFCSQGTIESLFDAMASAKKDDAIKIESKVENTSAMSNAGRAIASLKNSAARDPLSAMGQAEYQDIECAATASTGRFSDFFKSFDDKVLGGDSSNILSLGK